MKIYEEGKCYIVDLEDGELAQPYSSGLAKVSFERNSAGEALVMIQDQVSLTTWRAKVVELKNATVVISATGTEATDVAAVRTYLTAFLG